MHSLSQQSRDYSAKDIQVLKGLKAVQERPAMYIGDTGKRGLHHLVVEVVSNSVDEAMAKHCTRIVVDLNTNGSVSVADNGRGIPTARHPEERIPAVEVVMTMLHAGGKFDKSTYGGTSGGLHGVGVSCVNALSSRCIVEVRRNGVRKRIEFEKGVTTRKLRKIGKSKSTGTTVTWWADDSIFESVEYDEHLIKKTLKELAYLNPGLTIKLRDYRDMVADEVTYCFKRGIRDWVAEIAKDQKVVTKPYHIITEG